MMMMIKILPIWRLLSVEDVQVVIELTSLLENTLNE